LQTKSISSGRSSSEKRIILLFRVPISKPLEVII